MALKVKLSSGMKTVDVFVHKPVTFINGQKKVLDKGVVFIDGVKKYIWGKEGVPVDFIKTDGVGTGRVFSIGETWMYSSMPTGYIIKSNISNLDNPVIEQNVEWGDIFQYCGFQSSSENSTVYGSTKGNRVIVNNTTGNITIPANYPVFTGTVSYSGAVGNATACLTNNYMCAFTSGGRGLPSLSSLGNTWHWNNDFFATGSRREPLSWNNSTILQINTDAYIVNMVCSNTALTGLYLVTPSNITKVNSLMNDLVMLDGNILCGVSNYTNSTQSTFKLYNKSDYSLNKTYTHSNSNEKIVFLGRIGNNYYFVSTPKTNSATGAKVFLLNKDTLATVWTQDLVSDPFNENNGTTAFWGTAKARHPQVSKTGFLSVDSFVGGKFRCARFGELL